MDSWPSPSFYQALVDEEKTLLKGVLDALVHVGFADLKWAKMYQQRMACQADLGRLDASMHWAFGFTSKSSHL
jgi:hypothetical protein